MSWGTLLIEALRGDPDKVPKGWATALQIADEIGKSGPQTRLMLAAGIRQGKVERRTFRILSGDRIRPVPHYRKNEEARKKKA